MDLPLIIIGASMRAAAWSARRAGFSRIFGVDLFADADLARLCPAQRLDDEEYPTGFLSRLANLPPGPVMYTGALENHPRVLQAIQRDRTIWGNPPEVLRLVRNPFTLAQALKEAGLPHAAVRREAVKDREEKWLVKPVRGAGGAGIHFWDGRPLRRGQYLQAYQKGKPGSAVFCGFPPGEAVFLGQSSQWMEDNAVGGNPFSYRGSLFSLPTPPWIKQWETLGNFLVRRFGLRGLFGVDVVFSGDLIPLEVNPRYTASVEIIERSTGTHALAWHRAALDPSVDRPRLHQADRAGFWGKVILFARQPLVFPMNGPWQASLTLGPEAYPDFADIPFPGSRIEKGQPILSLFARADDEEGLEYGLREKAALAESSLYP